MNATDLIAAFGLPATARVDRRVPKTMLLEHGAPTSADRRSINDGIEYLLWVAVLKPTTIGVAEYRDEVREYLEIAVLHLILRPAGREGRLVELVHRAVPYPLLLVAEQAGRSQLSLAHKRWSQGESGKTVLDGDVVGVDWSGAGDGALEASFRAALGLSQQTRTSLYTLYQGWIDTVYALLAARRTGTFTTLISPDAATARRDSLRQCARLEVDILQLRAAAAKEKQIARQVEINLELKRVEAARAAAVAKL